MLLQRCPSSSGCLPSSLCLSPCPFARRFSPLSSVRPKASPGMDNGRRLPLMTGRWRGAWESSTAELRPQEARIRISWRRLVHSRHGRYSSPSHTPLHLFGLCCFSCFSTWSTQNPLGLSTCWPSAALSSRAKIPLSLSVTYKTIVNIMCCYRPRSPFSILISSCN